MESAAKKATVPGHILYLNLSKVRVKSDSLENATISQDNWKVLVCETIGK